MTHEEATQKFKRCRDKTNGYRLGNNTRLQQRGRAFAVRYYDTDVVMIRPDNTYRLNSDKWYTVTTKERINRFSPCRLSQTHGMWHINSVPYTDRMLIDSGGNPIHLPSYTIDDVWKIKWRVDKLFSKFVKHIAKAAKYQDIGQWSSYGPRKTPSHTSRSHLAQLWDTILVETSMINGKWGSDSDHLFKWIYFSVHNAGWRNKQLVFNMIRCDLMNGKDSRFMLDGLRILARRRKQHIVNMILAGELSDGTV